MSTDWQAVERRRRDLTEGIAMWTAADYWERVGKLEAELDALPVRPHAGWTDGNWPRPVPIERPRRGTE